MLKNRNAADPRADRVERDTLPVIDLSPLFTDDEAQRKAMARDIRDACVRSGFFYVVGHRVPADLMSGIMDASRALFALDAEEKQAIASPPPFGRGYAMMGGRALSGGAYKAVKEEFYAGRDFPVDDTGPNSWPASLPGFRVVVERYIEAMHELAGRLMSGIALSLDLPEDHFAAFHDQPLALLRLVRYPAEGAEAGAHTDFGALTLLLQDGAGGLQVFDRETDGWIHATPISGSFVVNVGDLIERWTNRLYRSTPHRVVHPPGVARLSVPFFFTGAADYPIVCLPACLKDGETPIYPPTTPRVHESERRRAQGF
jgi:isopenicillin N synthase-like dioxygenase